MQHREASSPPGVHGGLPAQGTGPGHTAYAFSAWNIQ